MSLSVHILRTVKNTSEILSADLWCQLTTP
jgi:hypothetical protein